MQGVTLFTDPGDDLRTPHAKLDRLEAIVLFFSADNDCCAPGMTCIDDTVEFVVVLCECIRFIDQEGRGPLFDAAKHSRWSDVGCQQRTIDNAFHGFQ